MAVLAGSTRTFGRYELLEYLGSGAMSDVFVAMHVGLRKRVALKILRPSLRHDRDAAERFSREGACAARVSHPNVVAVTDVGIHDDIPFLVMELLEGETLEQKLAREGALSLSAAVDLMLPIFEGVAAIHRAGVLHRDIKPANVLLARNADGSVVPKLVDFGIATVAERRNITGALGPIGTPHYMSPEQARGARGLDEKSDQYSLASMLFECLVGHEPFAGGDVHAVLTRVARGKFPKVRELKPSLPQALDDVLSRATALDPQKRFASVTEFANALVPFASARTRKLFVSREGRTGLLSAQLLSGVWRAFDESNDLPDGVTQVRSLPVRRRRAFSLAAISATALGLGIFVGTLAVDRGQTTAAAEAMTQPIKPAAEHLPKVQAPLAAPRSAPHVLRVTPSDAVIELDGRVVLKNELIPREFNDDRVHELRVSAPGYVTRVVLFRKTYASDGVVLEKIEP